MPTIHHRLTVQNASNGPGYMPLYPLLASSHTTLPASSPGTRIQYPETYACTTSDFSVTCLCEIIQQPLCLFFFANLHSRAYSSLPTNTRYQQQAVIKSTTIFSNPQSAPIQEIHHQVRRHVDDLFRIFSRGRSRQLRGLVGILPGVCASDCHQVQIEKDGIPGRHWKS